MHKMARMNQTEHDGAGYGATALRRYGAATCARSMWLASIIAEAFNGMVFLTHGRKISSPRLIGLPLRAQKPVFFEAHRRQS